LSALSSPAFPVGPSVMSQSPKPRCFARQIGFFYTFRIFSFVFRSGAFFFHSSLKDSSRGRDPCPAESFRVFGGLMLMDLFSCPSRRFRSLPRPFLPLLLCSDAVLPSLSPFTIPNELAMSPVYPYSPANCVLTRPPAPITVWPLIKWPFLDLQHPPHLRAS